MPPRDPMTFPGRRAKLDSFRAHMTKANKRPKIGVTQGGSSRKNAGAKPAATSGAIRQSKRKQRTDPDE